MYKITARCGVLKLAQISVMRDNSAQQIKN